MPGNGGGQQPGPLAATKRSHDRMPVFERIEAELLLGDKIANLCGNQRPGGTRHFGFFRAFVIGSRVRSASAL